MPEAEGSKKPREETYVLSAQTIKERLDEWERFSNLGELPEAPEFTRFIKELDPEGKFVIRRCSEDVEHVVHGKAYGVWDGEELVAGYIVHNQRPGEADRPKQAYVRRTDLLPGDYTGKTVVLLWDRYSRGEEGPVPGDWKRQDEFAEIPFP